MRIKQWGNGSWWVVVLAAMALTTACDGADVEGADGGTAQVPGGGGSPGGDNPGGAGGEDGAGGAGGAVVPDDPPDVPDDPPDDPPVERVRSEMGPPTDASEWLWEEQLTPEQRAQIERSRAAIDIGLRLGERVIVDEVNKRLAALAGSQDKAGEGGDQMFHGADPVGNWPQPVPRADCPILDNPVEAPGGLTCREVINDAMDAAYGQIDVVLRENPLDQEFDDGREENEFWQEQAVMAAIDNQAFMALLHARDQGLCDVGVVPEERAFEMGVEQGRLIYVDKVNQRLGELGFPNDYPNQGPINVCSVDGAILAPARVRSLDARPARVEANPLCSEVQEGSWEAGWVLEANDFYRDGMSTGIVTEHRVATQVMFRVVPCNRGDPLVLDLDGDGVELKSVRSGVQFDLFGWGEKVQTAWVAGDDALLAIDRDHNGRIDTGRELFANFVGDRGWNEVPSGFDNLSQHDANGDGLIDNRDPIYRDLLAWRDRNGDGISQSDELRPVSEAGVAAIGVRYTDSNALPLRQAAFFLRQPFEALSKGQAIGAISDAWFTYGKARPR